MTFKVDALSKSQLLIRILLDCTMHVGVVERTKISCFLSSQIMDSIALELGTNWRDQCFIFSQNGRNYGISIPHIEQGTNEEGRMFYFGVVPEQREKGYGKIFLLCYYI